MIDAQMPRAADTDGFAALTQELLSQHERLIEVSSRCSSQATSLREWEGRLREHEQELGRQRDESADERRNLELWRDELDRRARDLEAAERRVKEAREQQAVLAQLGHELVERFGGQAP